MFWHFPRRRTTSPPPSVLKQVSELGDLEDPTNDPSGTAYSELVTRGAESSVRLEDSRNAGCIDETKVGEVQHHRRPGLLHQHVAHSVCVEQVDLADEPDDVEVPP